LVCIDGRPGVNELMQPIRESLDYIPGLPWYDGPPGGGGP